MFISQFQTQHSFAQRSAEAERILKKYPNRIPVIVEKVFASQITEIDKKKYLVPRDLTVGQFMYVIRKRIKLSQEKAIFLFIGSKTIVPAVSELIGTLYKNYGDKDGFLYCQYGNEKVFG
jgi:GABA(A) receptor-associated protein